METRFVFPVTVATALHAFVLFGVKWPHHAITDLADQAVIRGVLPPPISATNLCQSGAVASGRAKRVSAQPRTSLFEISMNRHVLSQMVQAESIAMRFSDGGIYRLLFLQALR